MSCLWSPLLTSLNVNDIEKYPIHRNNLLHNEASPTVFQKTVWGGMVHGTTLFVMLPLQVTIHMLYSVLAALFGHA